jgi:predicted GNAT superfamily acetyltransferase
MAAGETTGTERGVKADAIEIRNSDGLEDMRACVALQKEVWGFSDADLVPLRIFVVAAKIGGQVVCAFNQRKLAGFALALPGVRKGCAYLHSQMLAVSKPYRDAGLGRRLKLFQRDDAINRGFELMEWTFDPLEIKNSYFNIERLGAIARRYQVNQYGDTSSKLQGGLPTDRLVAEWWLNSQRVTSLLRSGIKPRLETINKISVPAEIYTWKAVPEARVRALQVLEKNRVEFLMAFSKQIAVLGYERDTNGNGTFLLGRWEEEHSYPEQLRRSR